MHEPVSIEPDAVYDDGALYLSLGLTPAALSKGRRDGELRFTRRGKRTLYLGQWVLDWLQATATYSDAAVKEIEQQIVGYVTQRGDATIAEITRQLLPEERGEWQLELVPNVVIWLGLSRPLCLALQNLVKSGRLSLVPASRLGYMADGEVLTLPTVRRPPKDGYRHPHWLPVYLMPTVSKDERQQHGRPRAGGRK